RGRLPGRAVLHELDTDHETSTPDVPDRRVLLLQPFRTGEQPGADLRDVGQELALHDVECGEGRRAAHRVPAERAAVRAGTPFHDRFAGDDRADRHAAAEPLGREQDVGLDLFVLARPHFARTPDTALDLVTYEQDAVAIAQLTQRLEVTGRGHDVATLPLDRLHEHRGDARGIEPPGEQVVLDRRHASHGARGFRVAEVAPVAVPIGDVIDLGEK